MTFRQALLILPVLALTFAPAASAKHHHKREWRHRTENSAQYRNRYYNKNYRNPYNNGYGYSNGNQNLQSRRLDRNHDGVITPKERGQYYRKYRRQYPNGWRY